MSDLQSARYHMIVAAERAAQVVTALLEKNDHSLIPRAAELLSASSQAMAVASQLPFTGPYIDEVVYQDRLAPSLTSDPNEQSPPHAPASAPEG